MTEKGYNLHLGCGTQRLDGFINCDFVEYPDTTDMVFDLLKPWPLPDNSAEFVLASHVLEHLPEFDMFFKELWRVCKDSATCQIRVPYGGCRAAWSDPTHVRPWYPESFCHLQPGYAKFVHNLQYLQNSHYFHVLKTQTIATVEASKYIRWPVLGRFIFNHAEWFPEFFGEIIAHLQPIKTEGKMLEFQTYGSAGLILNELILQPKNSKPWRLAGTRKEGWKIAKPEKPAPSDMVPWKNEQVGFVDNESQI